MSDALTKHGIVVVTADGNDGVERIFESGGALLGKNTISVASIENSHYLCFKAYDISDKNFSIGMFLFIIKLLKYRAPAKDCMINWASRIY